MGDMESEIRAYVGTATYAGALVGAAVELIDAARLDAKRALEAMTIREIQRDHALAACGEGNRVDELREWAHSRIAFCRAEESRLGVGGLGIYEAAQERRTLQAVLKILDGEENP